MGTLYIVGTPIGNLQDLTLRAKRILGDVDTVLAEDTRHTKKLLSHLDIHKPLVSFHTFSSYETIERVLSLLAQGKNIAYVTDAGTPGISDPGAYLVQKILEANIPVVPIPGVSALTTLLSVAGIPSDQFTFLGFLPRKKGRQTIFKAIAASPYPIVFFESPHRIIKTLQKLQALGTFYCVVGRELTKQFEHIYRGTIPEVIEQITRDNIKGEFTVIIQSSK